MEEFDLSKYEITNPDEEFDLSKYEILNPEEESNAETLIDRINRYAEDTNNQVLPVYEDTGDNWLPFLTKKALNTAIEVPDIPANTFELGEMAVKFPFTYSDKTGKFIRKSFNINAEDKSTPWFNKENYFSEDNVTRPSKLMQNHFKKYGINLKPEPRDGLQRIVGHGIDFAAPGGLFALASKGNKLNNVKKGVKYGFDTGATSGTLQEIGLPPIASDIISINANPLRTWTLDKSYNIAKDGVYSVFNPNRLAEIKLNKLINNASFIKRDELGKLINYKPVGEIMPVTAEIAQNPGISALHNTYSSTLPQIRNTQLANDAIYRTKLNNIGTQAPVTAEDVGLSVRNTILDKLNKLKGIRESETAPLYAALKSSEKLYPVKHFSHNNKTSIKEELGDTKKLLDETSSILFDDVKNEILAKQQKMFRLKQKLNVDKQAVSKKISNPSESIYEQAIPDYNQRLEEIAQIERDIATQANNFTAAKIDKASTEIGNKILETKKSDNRKNKNRIRQLEKQKEALELDLASTPEGLAARQGYAKHSKPINEIEEDKLLKEFLKTDEVGNYKTSSDKAIKKISNASEESSRKLSDIIRDTEAGENTKKYLIDLYTEKTRPEWLPTASSSKSNRKTYGKYHNYLMTPEEQKILNEIDEYLQNRALHASGNFEGVGSATAPREQVKKEVQSYFGGTTTNLTPKFTSKYIPSVVQPNRAYGLLEEFLADPRYAQKTLRKKPLYVKGLKDRFSDYYNYAGPSIIYNNLKNEE